MIFMKSKEVLLLELMEVMHMRKRFGRAISRIKTDNPAIAAMMKSPIMTETADYVNKTLEAGAYELTKAAAYLYGTVLSRKDVKSMIRFYKYGAGRKFVEHLAELEQATADILVSWMTTTYTDIGKKANEELSRSEEALSKMEAVQNTIPDGTKLH